MEAVLQGLGAAEGDLRRAATLPKSTREARARHPTTGHIRLDERRQAIGPNYLIRFRYENGRLGFKTLSVAKNVEQTFGGYFEPDGPPPTTNTIPCKHGNPPSWTGSG
jgi:hypothetical protein